MGISVFIGESGASLYNSSKKISVYCKSTTDSELIALEKSTYLGDYYNQVLVELGYKPSDIYRQDNDQAIMLSE